MHNLCLKLEHKNKCLIVFNYLIELPKRKEFGNLGISLATSELRFYFLSL